MLGVDVMSHMLLSIDSAQLLSLNYIGGSRRPGIVFNSFKTYVVCVLILWPADSGTALKLEKEL
jgi:hypothetical protein